MHTTDITSKHEIEELMQEGGPPALIDFWAGWCGPCRAMAPTFASVAESMADEPVRFLKVDTEAYPEISSAFNVRSLPTVIAISDGSVEDVLVGVQSASSLERAAKRLLKGEQGFFERLFQ